VRQNEERHVAVPDVKHSEDRTRNKRRQGDTESPQRKMSNREQDKGNAPGNPSIPDDGLQPLNGVAAIEPFLPRSDDDNRRDEILGRKPNELGSPDIERLETCLFQHQVCQWTKDKDEKQGEGRGPQRSSP
jgi:hypothetical protein